MECRLNTVHIHLSCVFVVVDAGTSLMGVHISVAGQVKSMSKC